MAEGSEAGIFDELQSRIKQVVGDRLLLAKLEAADKFAVLTARMAIILLAAALLFMVVLFAGLAAGVYLSRLLHSYEAGFGIIAAFFLLFLIILLVFAKAWFTDKIASGLIAAIFSPVQEEEASKNT